MAVVLPLLLLAVADAGSKSGLHLLNVAKEPKKELVLLSRRSHAGDSKRPSAGCEV
jgi:hypothetical protein